MLSVFSRLKYSSYVRGAKPVLRVLNNIIYSMQQSASIFKRSSCTQKSIKFCIHIIKSPSAQSLIFADSKSGCTMSRFTQVGKSEHQHSGAPDTNTHRYDPSHQWLPHARRKKKRRIGCEIKETQRRCVSTGDAIRVENL